jgi:glyoxylase-like metal-dependent hydrolase (beta-lactamase superfamily II)
MWFPGVDNNAFLIAAGADTTLVDVGPPKGLDLLVKAAGKAGLGLGDVRHVVVTHCHTDHTGSLAAVAGRGAATVYGHAGDAGIVRDGAERPRGKPSRWTGRLMLRMAKGSSRADAAPVHVELADGQEIAAAGGMRCVHTPGHTGGHMSYLWPAEGVLFVGDAATNMFRRLDVAPINEDDAAARASFARLAELEFRVACFGHGSPITGGAADRFRRRLARVAGR